MRQAVTRRKSPRKTSHHQYPKHELRAAYALGEFAVKYWQAARKAMPEGSTIGDYRIKCQADFLQGMSPSGHGLLGAFLSGFNDTVAQYRMLGMPGFEDAREVLHQEALMYREQADDAAARALEAREAAVAALVKAGEAAKAAYIVSR